GFWDAWIHACSENWEFFKGIEQDHWPVLAEEIVQHVLSDSDIGNPRVLMYFDVVNEGGMWRRASGLY
ncbi:MAG: hypothetical protein ACE5LB_17820, partial [Acidiferrobacterales bacterium]